MSMTADISGDFVEFLADESFGFILINDEGILEFSGEEKLDFKQLSGGELTFELLESWSFLPGPEGPQGEVGPQGEQGIQGIQGLQGIQGEIGPQGEQGLQGIQGIQGIQGEVGPQGDQGIQGVQGPIGPANITWRDTWDAGIDYVETDAVFHDGASWYASEDPPIGEAPSVASLYWHPMSMRGEQGPQGIQGIQGIQGETGPQGEQGIQGIQGIQGETGPQGEQGIPGTGNVNSVNGDFGPDVVLDAADVGARPAGWVPDWTEITSKPLSFPPDAHQHPWADITGKPATYPPDAHNHDDRYFTETEADGRYLTLTGDQTFAGNKTFTGEVASARHSVAGTGDGWDALTVIDPSATGLVPHYGMGRFEYDDGGGVAGNNLALSGYFGISMVTNGTERLRIDRFGDAHVYGGNLNVGGQAVVKTNDARLSDARTPTTHIHDDRYYTETELASGIIGGTNLIRGGGFENLVLHDWGFATADSGTATVQQLAISDVPGSKLHIRLYGSTTPDTWLRPNYHPPLKANRDYTATVWVYRTANGAGTVLNRIFSISLPDGFRSHPALMDGTPLTSYADIPVGVWTRVKHTFRPTADVVADGWGIRLYAPTTGINDFWAFDNFKLEEGLLSTTFSPAPSDSFGFEGSWVGDFNNLTRAGVYEISDLAAAGYINEPVGAYRWGALVVHRASLDVVVQTYYPHDDAASIWTRVCWYGSWRNWTAAAVSTHSHDVSGITGTFGYAAGQLPYPIRGGRKDNTFDMNTAPEVLNNGFWCAAPGSTNTPEGAGASGTWYIGHTYTHDPTSGNRWLTQYAEGMTGGPNAGKWFYRRIQGNGYGAWIEMRPAAADNAASTGGGREKAHVPSANYSGTYNLDLNVASVWDIGVSGNITLTVSNVPPQGTAATVTVSLWGAGNGYTITPPANSRIMGAAIPTTTSSKFITLTLFTANGGTWWQVSAIKEV